MRRNSYCIIFGVLIVFLAWNRGFAGTIKGTIIAKGAKDGRDVVVYIDAIPGKTFPAPAKHAQIDQKNMEFSPHVLPVLIGTTVDFLNSDSVLHNVFTPDKAAGKFNLGTWPKGQSRSYTFKQPGAAVLLCNVHPEMEAYVVAVPTPYFAKTDRTGSYTIPDVPAGSYTLKAWHKKLKPQTQQVTVPASDEVGVDFTLSR